MKIKSEIETLAIHSAEGVPSRSVIRSSSWTTLFPGNKGLLANISAKIHPMLQISIAGVYYKSKSIKICYGK